MKPLPNHHEQRRRRAEVGQLAEQQRRGDRGGQRRDPEQRRVLGGRTQPLLQHHDEHEHDHRHGHGQPREEQVPARAARQRRGLRAGVAAHRVGVEHAEHPGQQERPAQTPQRREPLDRRHERPLAPSLRALSHPSTPFAARFPSGICTTGDSTWQKGLHRGGGQLIQ